MSVRRRLRKGVIIGFLGFLLGWAAILPAEDGCGEPAGATIHVPAGGDFQKALDAAQPGDSITLEAGATFATSKGFRLPTKPGAQCVVIRSAASDDALPPEGTRITPEHAEALPKLVSDSGAPVLVATQGAHHYKFVAVEITSKHRGPANELVSIGVRESSADQLPHHIEFDRVYIHGAADGQTKRGMGLNGNSIAVTNSHISGIKRAGQDAQALAGWNGAGPFRIVNNYLEATGENILFGGADPSIHGLIPSDIEIRRNHIAKPPAWNPAHPAYAGKRYTVKNLLELKSARRVRIEGNVLEHNWAGGQDGFAILFTVRNQSGGCPWCVIEDVTFANNLVRKTAQGINLLAQDYNYPSQRVQRVQIRNNVFTEVGPAPWGGKGYGRLFQITRGPIDLVIEHNTAFHTGNIIVAEGEPAQRFVFRNNIVAHNAYGVTGAGTPVGTATLDRFFPGWVFEGNVIIGDRMASRYPEHNFFVSSWADVGVTDPSRGEFALTAGSMFKRAGTDQKDIGVDSAEFDLGQNGEPAAIRRSRGGALPAIR